MRRGVPILFGLIGFAILVSLGIWQVQRLAWKQGILTEIAARIADAPVPIPADPTETRDQYLAVTATGTVQARDLRVLVSQQGLGAGYRIVSPFVTNTGSFLLDRGIMAVDSDLPAPPMAPVTVNGNLLWPDEIDGFTPDPDRAANIWFARDITVMAAELGTLPVLIVLRERAFDDGAIQPAPVGVTGIPNDHLGYAVTWFALAVIWAGMTGYFVWRMTPAKPGV